MESLGEKLKNAREIKDISLDQAGSDTKIALRYIEALEREDFSCFPSETYVTGFLRNYGVYLELDVQELFSLYRALKIQEQPVPVEQLLKPLFPLQKIILVVLLSLITVGLVGSGIYFLITRPPRDKVIVTPVPRMPVEHLMIGDSFEARFFRGDSILITVEQNRFRSYSVMVTFFAIALIAVTVVTTIIVLIVKKRNNKDTNYR